MTSDEDLTPQQVYDELRKTDVNYFTPLIICLLGFVVSSIALFYQIANGQGFSILVQGLSGWLIVIVWLVGGIGFVTCCMLQFGPTERRKRAQRVSELRALRDKKTSDGSSA